MLRLVLFDLKHGRYKCHYQYATGCNIANFDAIFVKKQGKSYDMDNQPSP